MLRSRHSLTPNSLNSVHTLKNSIKIIGLDSLDIRGTLGDLNSIIRSPLFKMMIGFKRLPIQQTLCLVLTC